LVFTVYGNKSLLKESLFKESLFKESLFKESLFKDLERWCEQLSLITGDFILHMNQNRNRLFSLVI
jgi:hypothetical protein